jgi:nicotinate-nucleotide adenylyltransferase
MPKLCFGGSFNPPHFGHLTVARAVARQCGYDNVVLIPNKTPPHKPITADLAGASDRLAMCRLAVGDDPLFSVSEIEIRRPGLSYTLETAKELRAQGADVVNWLIGADMLLSLPTWHKPLELLKEVNFVIAARPGFRLDWQNLPPEFRHLKDHVIEAPLLDISATDIRRRVATGENIEALVPHAVARYIDEHHLYQGSTHPDTI